MKGALLAALLVSASLGAAGCGATTTTSVALREARDSGGTQARAVRVEQWRISNGDAVDAVLVRARFCGTSNGYRAPQVNGRCVPSEVLFGIRPGARAGFANFLMHGEARMTAAAWKAYPILHIFPDIPGLLVRCKIPRGGGGTVGGLCEAKPEGSRKVAFLEHWPLSRPSGHRNTAGWVVTLDRSGLIAGIHPTGSTPPQLRR